MMIGAILLAAGESRRMGTQKLLLPFSGRTVVGHIATQLLTSRVDLVCVVTGHDQERVHQALTDKAVQLVHNPDYPQGMLTSVRRGLGALPKACDACLVALGDQPSLTGTLIDEMIRVFEAAEQGLLVPCYEGRRGHPLLVSSDYFEEIRHQFDDVGLRGLLQAHPDDVCEHPMSSDQVLSDMDYPSDYFREINRLS